jgi:hypothetical protein
MVIIAIVAALGLVGLVVITVTPIQQAEAKGCPVPEERLFHSGYINSDQKCFTIPNS